MDERRFYWPLMSRYQVGCIVEGAVTSRRPRPACYRHFPGPERMKAAQSLGGAVGRLGTLRPPSGSGAVSLKSKPRAVATWPIWSGFR